MPYKDLEKQAEATTKYYQQNSELVKARAIRWNKDNPGKRQRNAMNSQWAKIGMVINGEKFTYEHYDVMLIDQNFSCKICKKHLSDCKKALSVDHNHSTGEVRGLLCQHCNTVLGMALDDIKILQKAIEYLRSN